MIETPSRPSLDLSRGWLFLAGRARKEWLSGRSDRGDRVDLPHSWNEKDTFQPGLRSRSGDGAYRRRFEIPEGPGGGFWGLRSEGFYGLGEIWLDGRPCTKVDGQYLGFRQELDPDLAPGEHLFGLRLENRNRRNVLPGSKDPDFLLHGGLAGRVFLEWRPEVAFDVSSFEHRTRPEDDGAERIELICRVDNRSAGERRGQIEWLLRDPAGEVVAAESSPIELARGSTQTAPVTLRVPDPRRWGPEHPDLYWLEGRVVFEGEPLDTLRVRIGLVRAEFRPDRGLFLEGRRLELHGCNRHESIPGLGSALPEELQRRDAEMLRELGCNFVRLSHYPQHPAFLDACDEVGLFVYSEIATWKSVRSSPGWRRAARRQMRDLVLRDRHRPSILLWGMGNESRSRVAYLELRELVRSLDPDRPVTFAENHLYRSRRYRCLGIPDVWSTNYELGVLAEAKASSRLENVVVSECCKQPKAQRGEELEELLQVSLLEQAWQTMADRPYVAGYAVWSFTDYGTEHRRRYRRFTGLHDPWRHPKMAAELFRARHGQRALIALFATPREPERPPSRYRINLPSPEGAKDPGRELHVFSNCARIELEQDGAELAVLSGALHYVVPIAGAFDRIRAVGTGGAGEAESVLLRSGEATRISVELQNDRPGPGLTLPLVCSVCDAEGRLAHGWSGRIELSISGPARLRCFTRDDRIFVARGQGTTYLTCGHEEGSVRVEARAAGLETGQLAFPLALR